MSARTRLPRPSLLAALLLVGAVLLFHGRGLRPGHTFMPVDLAQRLLPWGVAASEPLQNSLISDPLYQYYPFLANNLAAYRARQLPLWEPDIYLGHPNAANPLTQSFYPPFTLLALALGTARGYGLGLVLHALLAALLCFGWLRALRCPPRAALLGALAYALSGFLVTWFETHFYTSTLAWLPGVLWGYERAITRHSLRSMALAGLALGLATLAGQVQFAATFALFFLLPYAVARGWEQWRDAGEGPRWSLGVLAGTALLGVGVGAVLLLPFAELLALSRRGGELPLADPLGARQLLTLLVPTLFGSSTPGWTYWGEGNVSESTIHAGVVTLALACSAPLLRRRPLAVALALTTLALLWFIVGGPGVGLLARLPLVGLFSLHRSTFLLPLLLAVLAALALSEPGRGWQGAGVALCALLPLWAATQSQPPDGAQAALLATAVWRAVGLLGVTALLLALRAVWPRWRPVAEWALVGLLFMELFVAGSHFNPVGDSAELLPPTPLVAQLRAEPVMGRTVALQQQGTVLFGPNLLALAGIPEASGYSSLALADYFQLVAQGDPVLDVPWMQRAGRMVPFSSPSTRLLDLLGVERIVSTQPLSVGVEVESWVDGCERRQSLGVGEVVAGTLPARTSAVNRLDLRLATPLPTPDSALRLRLWRSAPQERLVLEAQPALSEFNDEGRLTLYFAPDGGETGRQYRWELEATSEGVQLCQSPSGAAALALYGLAWLEKPSAQGGTVLWQRTVPVPPAAVVYATEAAPPDKAAGVARLFDPTFDLHNVALVSAPTMLPAAPPQPATPATLTRPGPNSLVVQARAERAGLLVVAEQFYPGWQATVDGRPVPIQRVNHLWRAVPLPAGDHEVRFDYAPRSFQWGSRISLATLFIALLLYLRGRRAPASKQRHADGAAHAGAPNRPVG